MNKPHKHAAIIKAWADGAEIEMRYVVKNGGASAWELINNPSWNEASGYEYRVKPEPKPDRVVLYDATPYSVAARSINHNRNLKLIFDGETGELKDAIVL